MFKKILSLSIIILMLSTCLSNIYADDIWIEPDCILNDTIYFPLNSTIYVNYEYRLQHAIMCFAHLILKNPDGSPRNESLLKYIYYYEPGGFYVDRSDYCNYKYYYIYKPIKSGKQTITYGQWILPNNYSDDNILYKNLTLVTGHPVVPV